LKKRKKKRGKLTRALEGSALGWRICAQEEYAQQREILRSREAKSKLKKRKELFIW